MAWRGRAAVVEAGGDELAVLVGADVDVVQSVPETEARGRMLDDEALRAGQPRLFRDPAFLQAQRRDLFAEHQRVHAAHRGLRGHTGQHDVVAGAQVVGGRLVDLDHVALGEAGRGRDGSDFIRRAGGGDAGSERKRARNAQTVSCLHVGTPSRVG